MIFKPLLILTIFILTFFHAYAISFAATASTYHVPIDSASGLVPSSANTSMENKRTGFFAKMKNKVARSLSQFFLGNQQKVGAKVVFSFASIAFVLLSVLALFSGSLIGLIIFGFSAILAGLISLFIKKDSSKKNFGNYLGLIGLFLGAVIFIVLAIAFFGSGFGH
jgi:hypothetical protein